VQYFAGRRTGSFAAQVQVARNPLNKFKHEDFVHFFDPNGFMLPIMVRSIKQLEVSWLS
jgi:hypothetical protein